jgi:hypothetical protein
MKTLLGRLFGLLLIGSGTLLTITNALAIAPEVPPSNAVPIPASLAMFGAGFAGFLVWRWRQKRHSKHDNKDIPS